MYGKGIDRARNKYKNPSWVELHPLYSYYRRHQPWVLYSRRHQRAIGYNIHPQSMIAIANSIGLKDHFNRVGAEKIKRLLLSWTKEQWELQHTRDIIEHGPIGTVSVWIKTDQWRAVDLQGDGWILEEQWRTEAFDYQI